MNLFAYFFGLFGILVAYDGLYVSNDIITIIVFAIIGWLGTIVLASSFRKKKEKSDETNTHK